MWAHALATTIEPVQGRMTEPVSPNDVEIAPGIYLPESMLRFTFARGSGPGGQNVNKVNTRATLTVQLDDLATVLPADALERLRQQAGSRLAQDPPRLIIVSGESRSQLANRRACIERLRELIVQALRKPRLRRKTRPSRRSVQRRLDVKKQRGRLKQQRTDPRRTDEH